MCWLALGKHITSSLGLSREAGAGLLGSITQETSQTHSVTSVAKCCGIQWVEVLIISTSSLPALVPCLMLKDMALVGRHPPSPTHPEQLLCWLEAPLAAVQAELRLS